MNDSSIEFHRNVSYENSNVNGSRSEPGFLHNATSYSFAFQMFLHYIRNHDFCNHNTKVCRVYHT